MTSRESNGDVYTVASVLSQNMKSRDDKNSNGWFKDMSAISSISKTFKTAIQQDPSYVQKIQNARRSKVAIVANDASFQKTLDSVNSFFKEFPSSGYYERRKMTYYIAYAFARQCILDNKFLEAFDPKIRDVHYELRKEIFEHPILLHIIKCMSRQYVTKERKDNVINTIKWLSVHYNGLDEIQCCLSLFTLVNSRVWHEDVANAIADLGKINYSSPFAFEVFIQLVILGKYQILLWYLDKGFDFQMHPQHRHLRLQKALKFAMIEALKVEIDSKGSQLLNAYKRIQELLNIPIVIPPY